MSSGDDSEIEEVADRLHRLHLERWRIYEQEKELIRELVELRRRKNAAKRQSSRAEQGTGERATSAAGVAKDRFGKTIKVGDTVEFLTPGRLVGKLWTVYRITEKRVLCERHNGVHKTHREFRNVKVVD